MHYKVSLKSSQNVLHVHIFFLLLSVSSRIHQCGKKRGRWISTKWKMPRCRKPTSLIDIKVKLCIISRQSFLLHCHLMKQKISLKRFKSPYKKSENKLGKNETASVEEFKSSFFLYTHSPSCFTLPFATSNTQLRTPTVESYLGMIYAFSA